MSYKSGLKTINLKKCSFFVWFFVSFRKWVSSTQITFNVQINEMPAIQQQWFFTRTQYEISHTNALRRKQTNWWQQFKIRVCIFMFKHMEKGTISIFISVILITNALFSLMHVVFECKQKCLRAYVNFPMCSKRMRIVN